MSAGATSSMGSRKLAGRVFEIACAIATWCCLLILIGLLAGLLIKAWPFLKWSFLTSWQSRKALDSGIKAGLWGSFWLVILTGLISVPMGVGAAVYLEEYAKPSRLTRFIQLNILNLAGVPSIVYGLLGAAVFMRMFGAFGNSWPKTADPSLPFGNKLISGALTLSLLVLPTIIISSQEALRAIPASLRHASLALGATRWQTIWHQVLPAALPGILTGIILALSRAVGETAPLMMIGASTYLTSAPGGIESLTHVVTKAGNLWRIPFDVFSTMPLQIYNWSSYPKAEFQGVTAAGIIVLLTVLLLMNTSAIIVRQRLQNWIRW